MDTKLHEVVRYGDIEGTVAALKAGFSPNEVGILQWTPVQEASHNGEKDILFHLLANGGNPNIQDALHGNTALHYAAQEGHLDCLRLLLRHKGNATLQNSEAKTCLDVASPGCKEAVSKLIMEFGGEGSEDDDRNNNERKMIRRPPPTEADKWNTLLEIPSKAAMGYLHLSFEYHKGALKVRVWQISDLLLPPPQISMIYSIFVRGYLIPDKAKKTNRRTEDVLVDLTDRSGKETPKTGIQHIFTPSSFKFQNPLLYTGVTADIIKERSLQLEVCMTQKQSHRTFLMAMVHMPLRVAVRRPIREKYPLIPCMNITIPNNMRVYSATELQLESSKGRDVKEGQKRGRDDNLDSAIPLSARTPREVELEDVVSLSGEDFLRSHLSLCLDDDSGDENDASHRSHHLNHRQEKDGGLQVVVTNGIGSGGSSSTTLNMPSSEDEEDDKNDSDSIPHVVTNGVSKHHNSTSIDMTHADLGTKSRKKIIPNELLQQDFDTDVTLDMPADETIVNMDISSSSDSYQDLSVSSAETLSPEDKPTRKKIIPSDLDRLALNTSSDLEDDGSESASPNDNSRSKENIPQMEVTNVEEEDAKAEDSFVKGQQSPKTLPKKHAVKVLQKESGSRNTAPKPSHSSTDSEGLSPYYGNDFSPASRPETPCWDFYDFDETLALQQDDDPETVNMTLDQSLARLQQLGLGSAQNLSMEPILPMELTDDFDTLEQAADSEQAADAEQAADTEQES